MSGEICLDSLLLAVNMIALALLLLCICCSTKCSIMVVCKERQAVTVGDKVTLHCHLQSSQPNVFQITWQKETGNFTGPVATCSRAYGERILGRFSNRTAQSTVEALNVSAITISPVTLEDRGCFKCIFNAYPIGANSGTVCLEVYERNISEPVLEIRRPDSQDGSEFHVVTCSATGKPGPQIAWNTTGGLTITAQTYTIVNRNGTVTTISNFTHRVTQSPGEAVICVVSHPTLSRDKYLSVFLNGTGTENSFADHLYLLPLIGFVIVNVICGVFIHRLTSKKRGWSPGPRQEDSESSVSSHEKPLLANTSQLPP